MTLFKPASLEISIGKKRVVSAAARGNLKRRPSIFSFNRRGLNGLGGNQCQMCTAGQKDGVGTNLWSAWTDGTLKRFGAKRAHDRWGEIFIIRVSNPNPFIGKAGSPSIGPKGGNTAAGGQAHERKTCPKGELQRVQLRQRRRGFIASKKK